MIDCCYWVQARGCREGNGCPNRHGVEYTNANWHSICHRFYRGECDGVRADGRRCNHFHYVPRPVDQPAAREDGHAAAAAPPPGDDTPEAGRNASRAIIARLEQDMRADITAAASDRDRQIKFRKLVSMFHPDRCQGVAPSLGDINHQVTTWLNNQRGWYCA